MAKISLKNLPQFKASSLIIRHAEREHITDLLYATSALLTEKGKNDSFVLGKELSLNGGFTIYHSPVIRCRQTAEKIHEGITGSGKNSKFDGIVPDLGAFYINGDWQEVVNEMKVYGMLTFIRKWFNGEYPRDLMMPLKEAAWQQAGILINQLNKDISCVNVTHDWNIMILREYFLNLKHEDIGPPDFLDGLSAHIDGDKIFFNYHEKKTEIYIKNGGI